MKVLSIIAAAVSTICFVVAAVLTEETVTEEYDIYVAFMLILSHLMMVTSALGILYSFKKR